MLGEPLRPIISRASANYQNLKLTKVSTVMSETHHARIDGHYEMLVEHPFDSTIKRMSTVWQFIPEDQGEDPNEYDLIVCE